LDDLHEAARCIDNQIVTRIKTKQTLFVLNRIDPRAGVDDTMARISSLFPNPPVKIKQRISYSRALITGRTGPEIDSKCAEEIETLWGAITGIMGDILAQEDVAKLVELDNPMLLDGVASIKRAVAGRADIKKLNMTDVQTQSQRGSRAAAEAAAQDAASGSKEGHYRRRLGKTLQIIFRVTPEKKEQLTRLADALSAGKTVKVTYTETLERALDALEASLRGKKQ
jgi:hypothetical protein